MLPPCLSLPSRVLMTVDGVGGVWRYGLDLARGLHAQYGVSCLLAGFGPRPPSLPEDLDVVWTDLPLDWMVDEERALDGIPAKLSHLADQHGAQLLHLNLPSQAVDLEGRWPIVSVSHSCVPSWWRCMRGTTLPAGWTWQLRRNRQGLERAQAVLAPSRSHRDALLTCYGALPPGRLQVVANATDRPECREAKEPFILAAGRWWDEGKNGAVLDQAAARLDWPVLMAGAARGPSGEALAIRHARALGPLAPEALAGLMRRAAILAAPSRYEPFGLVVLEAARQHAALVLADIPTFRELWEDAAVFVPPDDPWRWSEALAALAADATRRRQLGLSAAARSAEFTVERQLAGVAQAYARALVPATTG